MRPKASSSKAAGPGRVNLAVAGALNSYGPAGTAGRALYVGDYKKNVSFNVDVYLKNHSQLNYLW